MIRIRSLRSEAISLQRFRDGDDVSEFDNDFIEENFIEYDETEEEDGRDCHCE